MTRTRRTIAQALTLLLGLGTTAQGLTIYRIGGSTLPPPELPEGADFVQLDWQAAEDSDHGAIDLLHGLEPDALEPDKLDPTVNLAPIFEEIGGRILSYATHGFVAGFKAEAVLFDGDPETVLLGDGHWGGANHYRFLELVFEFPGTFTISRIVMYPRERYISSRFVQWFRIGFNDAERSRRGGPVIRARNWEFEVVYEDLENSRGLIELTTLPEYPVKELLVSLAENTQGIWELAEIEVYGRGYTPEATYVSQVIDLGGPSALGDLSWSAEVDPGADLTLRMRAGDDPVPNNYWRYTFRGSGSTSRLDEPGQPLTKGGYLGLDRRERAGITPDTENWDGWSTSFDHSEGTVPFQASRPRQYLQVRADFNSTVDAGSRLQYLQFAVSQPPPATVVFGEITPTMASVDEVTPFTYLMTPVMRSGNFGFDRILIDTPTTVAGIDGVRFNGQPVAYEVLRLDESGFEIAIPRVDESRDGELIEIDFRSRIFRFGTVFSGRVMDSQRPEEVAQVVSPGEADPIVDSNTLSVGLAEVGRRTVNALTVEPPVFSPNGDGINDRMSLEYELVNVGGDAEVAVVLYDLRGSPVEEVFRGPAGSGRFRAEWDGRDAGGRLLGPGIYILRIEVESDLGIRSRERVVSLVY